MHFFLYLVPCTSLSRRFRPPPPMDIFHCCYINILLTFTFTLTVILATDPYSGALLSLKSEFIDDHNSLDDWLPPEGGSQSSSFIHACSWSGVKCNKNSTAVISLDLSMKSLGSRGLSGKQFSVFTDLVYLNLSSNSLSGKFPVEISNLTSLSILDISRNNFSGLFLDSVSGLHNLVVLDAFSNSFSGPLPVGVSQLVSLKILNLAGSYFNGPIPSEYGSFQSLEFLHLAGNFLSGNIPPELGKLHTVTHMEIGYNSYEGGIPSQLGNMSHLQYLDIAGANLSGSIPSQLSNLTKLESLFLFRNQLSGLIPSEISRIAQLASLDLSDNQLSGSIPESFAELKNLRLMSLMYNEMNGTVPDAIAELPSLETLLIWSNYFSGPLPRDLGKNSKLKWLDVSTNNFFGSIPPDICSGGQLYKLILFSNNFSGSLSPSISNCSSLVRLRIEDNSFSGEIPLKFSHLLDMTYMDLSMNKFTGGIPSDIHQASQLQYFNISNNQELGGMIPPETWSLPLLQNFSASACNISGQLPPFKSCKSVSVIELDMNNLEGGFPASVSNCKDLERLDLAMNYFTGNIPEELASLHVLSMLDLSHNRFTGPIPEKLGDTSSLVHFNVSFNDISGSIPSNNVFRLMGSSAYIGNPNLCGAPLQLCSASISAYSNKGTKKSTLVLLLCAALILFIVAAALSIFYLRKGNNSQWKMVSFNGLPQFTANDILRSFSSTESMDKLQQSLSSSSCKMVLPTGITVSVKKIELEAKTVKNVKQFITQLGNARHKNVVRVLGFCYNKHQAYLLYDYSPNGSLSEKISMKRDWMIKYKLVTGIARGLCFLHHGCYPAIPHGELNSRNIVFDDNMEPQLSEFGFKYLTEQTKDSPPATSTMAETGKFDSKVEEAICMDIYNFGEIILEILTNCRLMNAGSSIQNKPREALLREIKRENESCSTDSAQEEMKLVLEVAMLCTRNRRADRPCMKDALKLLSGSKFV